MHNHNFAFWKKCFSFFSFVFLFSTSYCQVNPTLLIESGVETPVSQDNIIFSKNNSFLALTGNEQIKVYDLKTGFLLKKIKQENNYTNISFSSDFSKYAFTRLQLLSEPNAPVKKNISM